MTDGSDATYAQLEDIPYNCLYNKSGFIRLNSDECLHSPSGRLTRGWLEHGKFSLDPNKTWRIQVRGASLGASSAEVFISTDHGDSYVHADTMKFPSSSSYTTVTSSLTVQAPSGSIHILVGKATADAGNWVRISEISLQEQASPPPGECTVSQPTVSIQSQDHGYMNYPKCQKVENGACNPAFGLIGCRRGGYEPFVCSCECDSDGVYRYSCQ